MDDIKYETLVVNLKNLSLVGPNEKMVILEEKWIVVDKRYMQSFMRYWSGDNRTTLLAFIRGLVHDVVLCLKQGDISEDRRVKLMQLLPAVKAGLSNLRITYGDDRVSLFQLECLGDMLDLQLRDIGRILRGAARQKGSGE